jgi:hypothetical protein
MLEIVRGLTLEHPYWMALAALILGIVTDTVWVKWTAASNALHPVVAANWSAMIYVFGVSYTLIIVESNLLQIGAYVVGGWLGTFLTVWHHKWSRNRTGIGTTLRT